MSIFFRWAWSYFSAHLLLWGSSVEVCSIWLFLKWIWVCLDLERRDFSKWGLTRGQALLDWLLPWQFSISYRAWGHGDKACYHCSYSCNKVGFTSMPAGHRDLHFNFYHASSCYFYPCFGSSPDLGFCLDYLSNNCHDNFYSLKKCWTDLKIG